MYGFYWRTNFVVVLKLYWWMRSIFGTPPWAWLTQETLCRQEKPVQVSCGARGGWAQVSCGAGGGWVQVSCGARGCWVQVSCGVRGWWAQVSCGAHEADESKSLKEHIREYWDSFCMWKEWMSTVWPEGCWWRK